MTPERVREIAMEALAKRLEKHVDPSSWTTNFSIPTKELLEIIERLEPPMKDCPPTPQWQPMETAPRDGRWVLLRTPLGSLEVARFLGPGEKPWITKNGPHYGDYDRFLAGWFPIPGEEGPQ